MAMAMVMPMAREPMHQVETCSTRLLLSEVNPDAIQFFVENLLCKIYKHFDEQELIDVTFKLKNPAACVTAHRLILSSASPYFMDLFRSDRGICPLIEITDIDSDTFERLITFCYTGKTLINIDNVDKMLKGALTLQLGDAVANCVNFLIENINDYTLQRVYSLNNEIQCEKLQEKILEYEIKNFMKIVESDEFLNYDSNKLHDILQSDDLNVKCEEDVFAVVKRWYEHDTSRRKEQLPNLISCLRLTQFDVDFLMVNIHPLPGCQLLTLETITWVNFPATRGNISLKNPKPRNGHSESLANVSLMILKMSGVPSESKTIFQYNKTSNLWQKWRDIKVEIDGPSVIFKDENLIFTGGCRNNAPTNEAFSWNFKSATINRLPAMKQTRCDHSMVLLNGKIYAIGGNANKDGLLTDQALQSVETYSNLTGWKLLSPMIMPRVRAAAVVLNGKIYVIGGKYGDPLKSVECYDPLTQIWIQCVDMNEVHESPGATVHKGHIFVVGGTNSTTVERYDPQKNTWTKICSLNTIRCAVSCISIDNKLWAIGGQDLSANKDSANAQASPLNHFSFSTASNASLNIFAPSNPPTSRLSSFGAPSFPPRGFGVQSKSTIAKSNQLNAPLSVFGMSNSSSDSLNLVGESNPPSDPPSIFGQSNAPKTFTFVDSQVGSVSIYDEENDRWIDNKSILTPGVYYSFTVPQSLLNNK